MSQNELIGMLYTSKADDVAWQCSVTMLQYDGMICNICLGYVSSKCNHQSQALLDTSNYLPESFLSVFFFTCRPENDMPRQMQHKQSRLEPARTQQVNRDIFEHMRDLLAHGMPYDCVYELRYQGSDVTPVQQWPGDGTSYLDVMLRVW